MSGAADRLEDLLAAIRADLRRGDYARLEAHRAALEAALTGVERLPGPVLARLRQAAEANAACLTAARQGLRAARRRLDEIGAAARGEAYDARGRRHALGTADRRLRFGSNAPDFPQGDQERINPRRV